MSISFNEVPSNARIPGVYIEIDNSLANNAEDLQRVLIIGIKNGGDTAINLVSPITTPTTASDRFGADSQIHKMAQAFYDQNQALPMYAIAVDDATPDMAAGLAAVGDTQYHYIVSSLTDTPSMQTLADWLAGRYEALQQIPSLAFIAKKDTHANLITYASGFNSPFICCLGINDLDKTEAEIASAHAGQISKSLAIDPARPLQTLNLAKIYTNSTNEWIWNERNLLLYSGVSTYRTNDANQVLIERPITMYRTNNAGVSDDSYLDITVPATAMFFRSKQRSRILSKYPRHKLASDGTRFATGQAVVTPSIIKAELLTLYRELEQRAIVQDFDGYKNSLITEIDTDNPNRINVQDSPQFVNGLTIYAGKIQFRK